VIRDAVAVLRALALPTVAPHPRPRPSRAGNDDDAVDDDDDDDSERWRLRLELDPAWSDAALDRVLRGLPAGLRARVASFSPDHRDAGGCCGPGPLASPWTALAGCCSRDDDDDDLARPTGRVDLTDRLRTNVDGAHDELPPWCACLGGGLPSDDLDDDMGGGSY